MDEKPTLLKQISGFIIYLTGAVLALVMMTLIIWPDIEAITFDSAIRAEKQLSSLYCPVLMASGEVNMITIRVKNPADREVSPIIRTRITKGSATFVEDSQIEVVVPPRESKVAEWQVESQDAAYDQMIMARFYQTSSYPLPSRKATCGIYVLPFSGLKGLQFLIVSVVVSMSLMAGGLFLLMPKDRQQLMRSKNEESVRLRRRLQAFAYLGILFLVGILLAAIGNWLLSAVLAIVAVTSIIGVISYALLSH